MMSLLNYDSRDSIDQNCNVAVHCHCSGPEEMFKQCVKGLVVLTQSHKKRNIREEITDRLEPGAAKEDKIRSL